MMKWFYRWLGGKCNNAYFENQSMSMASTSNSLRGNDDGLNFQIYPATGGYVLEYSNYDRKNDRNNRVLHIITDEQDLGTSIAHAITIEMLRK